MLTAQVARSVRVGVGHLGEFKGLAIMQHDWYQKLDGDEAAKAKLFQLTKASVDSTSHTASAQSWDVALHHIPQCKRVRRRFDPCC